jgi:hypothetical protein
MALAHARSRLAIAGCAGADRDVDVDRGTRFARRDDIDRERRDPVRFLALRLQRCSEAVEARGTFEIDSNADICDFCVC